MKRALLFLATLAVGVLTLGLALPATREGRAEAWIAVPPDRLAELILDVAAQPVWRDLGRIEITPGGWTETTARGEIIAFTLTERSTDRIGLSMRSDRGWTGEWTATLTLDGSGTRIAVTERATVPNPLFRLLGWIMFNPTAFAARYLAELKAHAEGRT